MKTESKSLIKLGIAAGVVSILSLLFWLLCLNHVEVTNIGIAYNSINGNIHVQDKPGWYLTSPFVRVANLSVLPMRVTIPSYATIINQRIVRFKAEGAIEFVKLQGFSVTLGSQQENIMLGYAFSGHEYPFLEILEEPTSDKR